MIFDGSFSSPDNEVEVSRARGVELLENRLERVELERTGLVASDDGEHFLRNLLRKR